MNIRFSLFILKEKYAIEFPSFFSQCIPELGSLRNCIVHHDGNLLKSDSGGVSFRESLKNTLIHLGLSPDTKKLVDLSKNKFTDAVVFDLQNFIELCDRRIRKPKLYEEWLTSGSK